MDGSSPPGDLMRAAVVVGPGEMQVQYVPRPEPGPGQVRVKLEGCGVCASNLTPWAGPEWMTFPTEPGGLGHEGWGLIDAMGEGVTGLAIGDRVAALSYNSYAEYDLVDAAAAVRLPASLTGQPFPGEPLGCAMNIFARSDIRPGQTVAIVGAGFLGAVLTRLATHAGARVIATAGSADKCRACLDLGADHAIDYRAQDFVALAKEYSGGGVNLILDMVGGDYIARNYEAAAMDGRIVQIAFLGGHEVKVDFRRLMLKRLTHTGSTLRPRSVAEKAGIAGRLEERVKP